MRQGWWRAIHFSRRDVRADVDDELGAHLLMRAEEYEAAGMSPQEARAEAMRRFGNLERARDACRRIAASSRRRDWRSGIRQDLVYAVRTLARSPGLTAAILITLSLGIGANTAIFTVVKGVLLRPLPYADPERLVSVYDVFTGIDLPHSYLSEPELIDLERSIPAFSGVAGYRIGRLTLTGVGTPDWIPSLSVTASFPGVLGVRPSLGRFFEEDEDRPGQDQVVVLDHGFWVSRFGGDPGVIGHKLSLNGSSRVVVGVMPRGFTFGDAAIYVPAAIDRASPQPRTAHYLRALARLRPGVTGPDAVSELAALVSRLVREDTNAYPANMGFSLGAEPLSQTIVGSVRPALLILLGAVGLLLVVACANVANLLLVRAEGRHREFALRTALGAGRGRLIRQLLTESIVLSVAGGALGLLLAAVGVPALLALDPTGLPRQEGVAIDYTVCALTLGLAMITGIAFGLAPALQAMRVDPQSGLKDGGSGGTGRRRGAMRRAFVVVEVSLAVVLVAGAALLIQAFLRLRNVDVGFRPDHLLTLDLSLPETRYTDSTRVVAFYDELLRNLASLPGVITAGASSILPLTGAEGNWDIEVEGRPARPEDPAPSPGVNIATPGYYAAMRIPVLRGRVLAATDDERATPVAVINEEMARSVWRGEDPVGRRFRILGDSAIVWITVVGVTQDVRSWGISSDVRAEYTLAHRQMPVIVGTARRGMAVMVRTSGDPLELAGPVRRQVAALDSELAVSNLRTMDRVVSDSLSRPRFTMLLLALFGTVALALAAIGVYGVMAHGVAQRAREIGIRLALGAQPGRVRRLIVAEGLALAIAGLVAGVLLALLGSRLLASQLYGITPTDPPTYLGISILLLAVAFVATWQPARRATQVDPLGALRAE